MPAIPALFIDECVRGEVVQFLRSKGVDLLGIVDFAPSADDPAVIREAAMRQRVLVTADYDFGELQFKHGHAALGMVLIALDRLRVSLHGPIVHAALVAHRAELIGSYLTIEPARTRVRKLGTATL